jgi:hypothetical protein
MAIRYAIKNGLWSDPTTWDGAIAIPTSSDDVRSNNFTVTVNVFEETITPSNGSTLISLTTGRYQVGRVLVFKNEIQLISGSDFTATDGQTITLTQSANGTDVYVIRCNSWQVLTVSNVAGTGFVRGGFFSINGGVTFNATTIENGSQSAPATVQTSFNSPESCVINANLRRAGSSRDSGSPLIFLGGTGQVTINANFSDVGTFTSVGIRLNQPGILNYNGNLSAPTSNADTFCIDNVASGIVNIVGNISSFGTANQNAAVRNNSAGTINFTGNISGSSVASIINVSSGTINITGDSFSGNAIINLSNGIINITGTLTGGTTGSSALSNNSNGVVSHIGASIGGGLFPAISTGSTAQRTYLTGPFISTSIGVVANVARTWNWISLDVGPTYVSVVRAESNGGGYRNLFTADNSELSGGVPIIKNVRLGTVYGPDNEFTGTIVIPPRETVFFGIPVDNTTGTFDISTIYNDVWSVPLPNPPVPGSVGERIAQLATLSSVGDLIASMRQS